MTIILVAVAGSAGALARYLVSGAVHRRTDSSFPFGTAAVNLLAAFALGLVLGAGGAATAPTLAAGFLGGFSTFSTWMIETVRLGVLPRPSTRAILNLTLVTGLGLLCAALGVYVTS